MGQNLQQLMRDNRKTLLDQWFHQFIGAYPQESVKYFERVENEFTNPIGSNVHRSLVAIFDELLGEQDADKLYSDLEMIMRIKAVQDVTPSQAIAFVFGLKSIIRKAFTKEISNGTIKLNELLDFEDALDTMALLAFNIYVDSRELIMICAYRKCTSGLISWKKRICSMKRWILARLCVAVTIWKCLKVKKNN